jgi:molecular chaperone DnaK
LPANSQLPASSRQIVGTVSDNQRKVHLRVVESGTAADAQWVELGMCVVDPLPDNLPEGAEIEVTIRYDEQARVHVSAKVLKNGQTAHAEIVRPENLLVSALAEETRDDDVSVQRKAGRPILAPVPVATTSQPLSDEERPVFASAGRAELPESSDEPLALCPECATALDRRGVCPQCAARQKSGRAQPPEAARLPNLAGPRSSLRRCQATLRAMPVPRPKKRAKRNSGRSPRNASNLLAPAGG